MPPLQLLDLVPILTASGHRRVQRVLGHDFGLLGTQAGRRIIRVKYLKENPYDVSDSETSDSD